MFSFRTTSIDQQLDKSLTQGLVVCFCTPSCYDAEQGRYTWQIFSARGNLHKLVMPFEAEFETAQNHSEVTFSPQDFEGVSAVVVDIQDSGSRYFSCTRSVFSLMRALHQMGDDAPSLYVVDHLNPAGRCVEGTMPAGSKGGDFPKTCHRHGLSLGELCHLYQNEISFKSPLHIISALAQGSVQLLPWAIPPSVDIPGLFTCDVYSGAYLWQKTNISPALGTPRPYEYFGAPFIQNTNSEPIPVPEGVLLRPCTFMASAGMYAGQVCRGYQILLLPGYEYHALSHTLQLMRYFKQNYPQFALADDFAAELGDDTLYDYVLGGQSWPEIQDYLKTEEQKWIRKARKFTLYENYPYRIK